MTSGVLTTPVPGMNPAHVDSIKSKHFTLEDDQHIGDAKAFASTLANGYAEKLAKADFTGNVNGHANGYANSKVNSFSTNYANSRANGHASAPVINQKRHSSWNLDGNGRFIDFPGDISSLLIPDHAGASVTTRITQRSTKIKYLTLLVLGLMTFYSSTSPRWRTAGVSLMFPGAGFLSMGGIGGVIGFTITVLLMPACLFAWFGAGGLAFPLADWILSGIIATYFTGNRVFESSGLLTLWIVSILYTYLQTRSSYEEIADKDKRMVRNRYLEQANQRWEAESEAGGPPGTREIPLEDIRFIQRVLELAMQEDNDWEGYTIIDQYQPAALRYQLYEFVNVLGVYQCIYTPNFHGYIAEAMRNTIEKSLVPKVMNFWKWESLWGKFTTNYDPVIKDNIMVTGFLTLAIGIYQSCIGDDRYTKEQCLNFQITDKKHYRHDLHSMYKALTKNWDESEFTLYPCEPNWIYSMCNLVGMSGATVYDRLFKSKGGRRIMKSFYKHFEEDFFTAGGSCIPIKSGLTGFTIPGLCGIIGDCSNALFCSPSMPTLAKRMWLITREENLSYDKDGKLCVSNLQGADKIDAGNYTPQEYNPYAIFSTAAAEWGDTKIAKDCIDKVNELTNFETNPKTGAKWNKGVSTIINAMLSRTRITKGGDWARTVALGPQENCLAGPILEGCPYPEVLVAKAYSHTSKDLELVLYPGMNAGEYTLGLTRLQPRATYTGQDGQRFEADASGNASLQIKVDGRTLVHILPVS